MACSKRWSVTYTKHMKQKRKIYQDGVLELNASGDKVMLYDESEKLIDGKFLRKDDVVECGGSLTLEAYLVDIGDPIGDQKEFADMDTRHRDKQHGSSQTLGEKENNKSLLQRKTPESKGRCKTVESKATKCKSRPPQNYSKTNSSCINEWNVLYTTQLTQKAKKYHDGILRLVQSGSLTKQLLHLQILLLKEDGTILSNKYLNSIDSVESGSKYELPNYLVEICEPRILQEDIKNGPSQVASPCISRNTKIKKKGRLEQGATLGSPEIDKLTSSKNDTTLRDASQILSILKKPLPKVECGKRKLPVANALSAIPSDITMRDIESQNKANFNLSGKIADVATPSGTEDDGLFPAYGHSTSVDQYSRQMEPEALRSKRVTGSADKVCLGATASASLEAPLVCSSNDENADQISKDNQREGKWDGVGSSDASAATDATSENFQFQNSPNKCLTVDDDCPTFDLGF
ncbi:uncharacterized protein LOC109723995 isoform X1 [Ananas comosus]|uniref:Uncharacterized protein LOC109723995 isoform X1 n=1 Tax=Ananas comosus TaxID=4615 RepID=A0A6P5GHL2_ANACO|nr:uncharacterized protein LOC109723995 isoform X1 [Ananas comosus]XP_020108153.1 uncharacterized protein LOC109723995 isoform X1 [Ananas comosus]XP_020108154.1 uncharacterized protein LOC109723995 isoform X1 [Ananas comosus]XP_020108155.1 uncharacterized protein LOC109723995 isoform X1 [Ananas comosus]XP_020108156.1 uncharacterized protein LOC109723995 isoform X1 [Ananas comosus]XP_020108157.1 uncharacterized protein LOC109723995 isoform X1 [Ananas comosus]XP_020108158.1 uncharacterized prot